MHTQIHCNFWWLLNQCKQPDSQIAHPRSVEWKTRGCAFAALHHNLPGIISVQRFLSKHRQQEWTEHVAKKKIPYNHSFGWQVLPCYAMKMYLKISTSKCFSLFVHKIFLWYILNLCYSYLPTLGGGVLFLPNNQADWQNRLLCWGTLLNKQIFILGYSAVIHEGIHTMRCLVPA